MARDDWDRWTRGTAIRRAGYAGFKRNVAVDAWQLDGRVRLAAGDAVAELTDALAGEEPLVREHAPWALEQRVS